LQCSTEIARFLVGAVKRNSLSHSVFTQGFPAAVNEYMSPPQDPYGAAPDVVHFAGCDQMSGSLKSWLGEGESELHSDQGEGEYCKK
jgi:hypothetical protein